MNAANRQTAIRAELASFRVEVQKVLASPHPSTGALENVIQRGMHVDSQFLAWTHDLPSNWAWEHGTRMPLAPGQDIESFVYDGRMDVYDDLWVACIWNCYRFSRIILNKVIMECIDCLDAGSSDPTLAARRHSRVLICQEMADDICGSVPFHLGTRDDNHGFEDSPLVEFPLVDGIRVPSQHRRLAAALGGWFLVEPFYGPLQTCLSVERLREGQKEWVGGQLGRISRIYNVKLDGLRVG